MNGGQRDIAKIVGQHSTIDAQFAFWVEDSPIGQQELLRSRIGNIGVVGLSGVMTRCGWITELRPDSAVRSVVFIDTADGVSSEGSFFTSFALMHAATAMLGPLWCAENALRPDRLTAELHQRKAWLEIGTLTSGDAIDKVTNQPMALLFKIDDILTTSHASSPGVDFDLEVLHCFNGDTGDTL